MPSRRAKSKRRQKSKLRQSQHLEQKPVLKNKTEDKKEEAQQDSKAVLLEHYARTVQQRSLVEVALLCLLFNNEIMASSWKLGDLSKSLLGFLMGSQNEGGKEPSPPIKNSYSSVSKTTVKEQTAKANLVQETPQTMPRRKKRTSELQKETPPKQLLQKSLKDKEVLKDENESSSKGRESCEEVAGFVTEEQPAVEQPNSLVVTDISSELTSNSKGEEDFPASPSSVPSRKPSREEQQNVIENVLSEKGPTPKENVQEFQEESRIVVTTKEEAEMTEISDVKDNDAFTHDCNLNPQNASQETDLSVKATVNIPAPPPPPPPGFLVPEKPLVIKNEKEKPEKLPKVSPAEKALLRQLESIDDPTFKSFLKGQLKVKNSSRDRRETENEM